MQRHDAESKASFTEKVAQVLHNDYGDCCNLVPTNDRYDFAFFESIDGGVLSKDRKRIYFVGIIDTLTYYGAKKQLEYNFKHIVYGRTISCVPPKQYGERFFNYASTMIQ